MGFSGDQSSSNEILESYSTKSTKLDSHELSAKVIDSNQTFDEGYV